jgi:hypothetical protein
MTNKAVKKIHVLQPISVNDKMPANFTQCHQSVVRKISQLAADTMQKISESIDSSPLSPVISGLEYVNNEEITGSCLLPFSKHCT